MSASVSRPARAPAPQRRCKGLSQRALALTLALVERRLGESVSLGELANVAAVSRFHFSRMFRVSTGFSPMGYLLHRRIEAAKAMLERGAGPIADVAAALGFCDQSHFTRRFRRLTGLTPRAFAQGCRAAPPCTGRTAAVRRAQEAPFVSSHFAVRNGTSAAMV